jgi:methionine-rich copper-binding protein CopC
MSRSIRRFFLLFVFLSLLPSTLLFTTRSALAHADYERSDPAAGSVVPKAPDEVHIWFTQELFRREGENSIEVLGPDGEDAHAGGAVIDDDDRAHMWVELKAGLSEGDYLVRWRSLSADDGDTEEGEFTFTVDLNAPDPTPLPATPTNTAQPPAVLPTVTSVSTAEGAPSGGLPCLGSALLGFSVIALGSWRRRH